MRLARFLAVTLSVALLTTFSLAAETTNTIERKPEAKVDKALTKPKQDIQRFWVTPEMLIMWSKDGPVHDVRVSTFGLFLAGPAPQYIFENKEQDYGMQMGGRLAFGMWADDARKWGFELSGFALQEEEDSFKASSNSYVWPYFDTTTNTESAFGAFSFAGPIRLEISSKSQVWGVEGLGLHNFKRSRDLSLDMAFGVKHLDLSEDFVHQMGPGVVLGHPYYYQDSFSTRNQFFGAKVGLRLSYTAWERLLIDVQPAVSLGADLEKLDVSGYSSAVPFSGPGFIYTGVTNTGEHKKTTFAVVPEIKVGLGCQITKNLSFHANYNFLYVSDVLRPGEQVSRRINPANVLGGIPPPPGPPNDPRARMESSDYWAHGVGVNLKIKF